MPRYPDYLVASQSCVRCTSAALSVANTQPRYCLVRFLLVNCHLIKLSFWSGVKEVSTGHNEVLDTTCKCDSDVEDDGVSEPVNEDKSVQTQRSVDVKLL